ncbi:hypothetical protein EFA46_012855 (plasmid) [Halarchaeum sp. CBA1220]|uniref:hypothetical protein n=1 Tax=Halarchaeum sp. CBA1220 TaxID=1853682 RepID=UPI001314C07C|nr:hypothetical protein [Halarchaeum sp. CBA1220]QLC35139.1 hypothetical protein EFA46_012855 [Halarchaeum sp. CBA1220]
MRLITSTDRNPPAAATAEGPRADRHHVAVAAASPESTRATTASPQVTEEAV